MTPEESPSVVNTALDNVARLMNLHVVGGVPVEKLHVVVALHKEAIFTLMDNDTYQKKFKTDNPNLGLLKELQQAGVKIVACGQSLLKRNVDYQKLAPGVEVATSMLTTVTMYQLKGYAMLKF
jgi:intracellular sulfur oxidation DsrE/DsrF family protein